MMIILGVERKKSNKYRNFQSIEREREKREREANLK